MIQLMKEDSVGRPIYKRKEPTSQGKQVYLYHIHQTKKWRIGPAHEGAEAHNCWLFITSKGNLNAHIPTKSDQSTCNRLKIGQTATFKVSSLGSFKPNSIQIDF